jgi:hypothetical protein
VPNQPRYYSTTLAVSLIINLPISIFLFVVHYMHKFTSYRMKSIIGRRCCCGWMILTHKYLHIITYYYTCFFYWKLHSWVFFFGFWFLNYCNTFSGSALRYQIISLFFKIHFGNKKNIFWNFDNKYMQLLQQVHETMNP